MSVGKIMLLAAAGASGGEGGWIRIFGSSQDKNRFNGIHVDSSDDIYVVGQAEYDFGVQNFYDGSMVKYDTDGTLQWQKSLEQDTSPSESCYLFDVVESGGNSSIIYVLGYTRQYYSSGSTVRNRALVRRIYKSDGSRFSNSNVTFYFGTSTTPGDISYKGAVFDGSNNIFLVGETNAGSGNTAFFTKKMDSALNSPTGTFNSHIHGTANDEGYDVAVDSSNNIYMVGRTGSAGSGSYDQFIAKYNNTGTLQWQRCIGYSGSDSCYGVTIDGSGDILMAGGLRPGSYAASIIKINSSGTLQSTIAYRDTVNGGVAAFNDIAIDSSGNIYGVGYSYNYGLIMKFSSSGTLLWQNYFYAGTSQLLGIAIDSNDQPIVCGYFNGIINNEDQAVVAKLPSDGSGLGTYSGGGGGSITYAAASLSSMSLTPTVTTSSITEASLSVFTSSDSTIAEPKTTTHSEYASYTI